MGLFRREGGHQEGGHQALPPGTHVPDTGHPWAGSSAQERSARTTGPTCRCSGRCRWCCSPPQPRWTPETRHSGVIPGSSMLLSHLLGLVEEPPALPLPGLLVGRAECWWHHKPHGEQDTYCLCRSPELQIPWGRGRMCQRGRWSQAAPLHRDVEELQLEVPCQCGAGALLQPRRTWERAG